MSEHEEKYERLAIAIGIDSLRELIPVPPESIKVALAAGDEHLNTIPLKLWDRAAGMIYWNKPFLNNFQLSFSGVWCKTGKMRLSLADRVCILKHVAKFHL